MIQKFLQNFMSQNWEDLLFLHWPIDPNEVSRTLPDDLKPDLFKGQAWVSVVGFRLTGLRIKPFKQIAWNDFIELNLRTYVRNLSGARGVWFYSLDSSDLLAVLGARMLYGLNYRFASLQTKDSGKGLTFQSKTRFGSSEISCQISADLSVNQNRTKAASFESHDNFLLERYRFWANRGTPQGSTSAKVAHVPYEADRLMTADYSGDLFQCHGFDEPDGPPAIVHYCRGLAVQASAPSWMFWIAGQANQR